MKYEVTLHQSDHYRKTFKIIASNLDKANEEAQKILDSVDLRTQRETFSESESSFDISELPQEEKPKKRLEYLRKELRAERISYEELAELQSLVEHIDPSDVELLEAAGVEEHESETPLFTALKNSEVALINKLSQGELENLEGEIRDFLKSREESVEGMFNPDEEGDNFAVDINSI